ncbi:MAG: hypothetical protein QXL17_02775 [Candidatus Thermoplasmatota archaeon]
MKVQKYGTFQKKVSVDTIQFYLANGAKLHPLTYDYFIKELSTLEIKDKICPIPCTIFERFHLKLRKTA